MRWSLRIRLSLMFFLQFAVWGAWLPVISDYLKNDLGFTGSQLGWVRGAMWLACIVAPFVGGQIADRWMPTQWFLAAAHLASGVGLLVAAQQQHFGALMVAMLVHCLFYAPTMALTNSLCFRHLSDVDAQFGSVRVFGTVGWIVVSWCLTFWRWGQAAPVAGDMLMLGGWCGVAMGVFCLFLPHTPPPERARSPWAFLDAARLLRDRQFLVFMVLAFLMSIGARFYYVGTAPFLRDIGIARSNLPAVTTVGRFAEIAGQLMLPFFLVHLGIKRSLAVGCSAWLARSLIFALCAPVVVVVGSLALHGIAFPLFFVVSQMYVDRVSPRDIRASAQALLTLVTLGLANFLGVLLTGVAIDALTGADGATDWCWFFLISCGIMAVCVVGFLVWFREPAKRAG